MKTARGRTRSALLGLAFMLSQGPTASAQVLPRACSSAARPPMVQLSYDSAAYAPASIIDRMMPGLLVADAYGLEDQIREPNPVGDSLRNELRQVAQELGTARYQFALAQIIALGAAGAYAERAANSAAVWYRQARGPAPLVLGLMNRVPSDRFLLALSALNPPLDSSSQAFVFTIGCEVALPLIALRRSGINVPWTVEGPRTDARILRHVERLLSARYEADIATLIEVTGVTDSIAAKLEQHRFDPGVP